MPAGGGSRTVSVTTGTGCAWTASTGTAWITITSGAGGKGNGSVAFNVAANLGPAGTGTLTIGGQTFTVDQASGCVYSINPRSRDFDKEGGTGSVQVTAPVGCGWTATPTASWITVTAGGSGSGNGTVTYTVAEVKPKGTRTGTITIAGQTFTVEQEK